MACSITSPAMACSIASPATVCSLTSGLNIFVNDVMLHLKTPTRVLTVETPENVERVRVSLEGSPRRSTRRRCQALEISRTSMQAIIRKHLNFHPYKIVIVQKLLPNGTAQRWPVCEEMLDVLLDDVAVVITSDEAHFHSNGYVNKQNCRYWARENPIELHKKPLHSHKVTVWCALSKVGIVGSNLFEDDSDFRAMCDYGSELFWRKMNWIFQMYGFNRMELLLTQREFR